MPQSKAHIFALDDFETCQFSVEQCFPALQILYGAVFGTVIDETYIQFLQWVTLSLQGLEETIDPLGTVVRHDRDIDHRLSIEHRHAQRMAETPVGDNLNRFEVMLRVDGPHHLGARSFCIVAQAYADADQKWKFLINRA